MASRRVRGRRRRFAWVGQVLGSDLLWSGLGLAAIAVILLPGAGPRSFAYNVGDIADAEIIAPVDLRVQDRDLTETRRLAARSAAPDVYDLDPTAWLAAVQSVNDLFAWGRLSRETTPASWDDLTLDTRDEFEDRASTIVGLTLPIGFVPSLWSEGFTATTELAIEGLLRKFQQLSMIWNPELLGLGNRSSILVRDVVTQQEETLGNFEGIMELERARAMISRELKGGFELSMTAEEVLGSFVSMLLRPNLTYNSNETQRRAQAATAAVEPVFYVLKRGRAILREGDEVTDRHLLELAALVQQWGGGSASARVVGLIALIALTVHSLWRHAAHHRRRFQFQKVSRLYPLLLLVLVGTILMTRVLLFIGEAVAGAVLSPPFNLAESYAFAIPFAVGPLLILLLVNAQVAWVFAAVQAIVIGAMSHQVDLTLYAILGSFAGVYGMSQYKQRTEMIRTGLMVASVNAAAIVSLALINQPVLPWPVVLFRVLLGIFGGIQVALLASALLPVLEHLFRTMTDVKLLELSNMNLPLLKQLAVNAPGTYHHSVVVGTLAEKAAEAIDANPLFARVAAYYHDIGKMRQPEYFVENQKGSRNPHDRLTPSMSALVLVSHIKEGIAYAEEQGLPQPLVDIIPQHHGTRLMKYFYERARQQAQAGGGEIRPETFRYPGPTPRSKEAALIMMADSVEAISRLIYDPSPSRLRTMIRKNIREIFEDGQLDECGLTLADLTRIADAFLTVLVGMHHQRIEYPGEEPPESEEPLLEAASKMGNVG